MCTRNLFLIQAVSNSSCRPLSCDDTQTDKRADQLINTGAINLHDPSDL